MNRNPLPSSWVYAALETLLTFVLGGDWGKDEKFNERGYQLVRCIRASELRNWQTEKGTTAALRKVKQASLEKRELIEGDILIEISGGGPDQPVGRTVVIDQSVLRQNSSVPKICTNFFRLARPYREIDSNYLNYYLQHFYQTGRIAAYQAGSNNLRNLKFNDYLTIQIPIPPQKEQSRVVTKIEVLFSELDKGIEALETARDQLKVYRQAVLKHAFEGKLTAKWRKVNKERIESPEQLFSRIQQEREARYQQQLREWERTGKPKNEFLKPRRPKPVAVVPDEEKSKLSRLPEGWSYVCLGNFISSIEAGKSFKCDEREPGEGDTGVAKVSAVSWGEYDETESKTCVDPERINEKLLIQPGDFILSRANTIELVGACVIARRVTKPVMLSDKTLRLSFGFGDQSFFLHYLRSRQGRDEIQRRSTGNQESMRNIGQDRIRDIIVPACSRAEMKEVVLMLETELSRIEFLTTVVEEQLNKCEMLRQSILKKAFSGQLVAQDANDEPAVALFERIRTKTKEAVPPKRRTTKAAAGALHEQ